MFADALTMKNALAVSLAEAEQKCFDWESAVRQIMGEAEVQKITEGHTTVDAHQMKTAKGKYITAITRIRLQDFCLSRKTQKQYVENLPRSSPRCVCPLLTPHNTVDEHHTSSAAL